MHRRMHLYTSKTIPPQHTTWHTTTTHINQESLLLDPTFSAMRMSRYLSSQVVIPPSQMAMWPLSQTWALHQRRNLSSTFTLCPRCVIHDVACHFMSLSYMIHFAYHRISQDLHLIFMMLSYVMSLWAFSNAQLLRLVGDTQLVVWQDISLLGTDNYLNATEVSDVLGSVLGGWSYGWCAWELNSWCYFEPQPLFIKCLGKHIQKLEIKQDIELHFRKPLM